MDRSRSGIRKSIPAFSIIEIVIGLLIISLMVTLGVSNFNEQGAQVKEDSARQQLQTVGNAIARWQLENNRTYPYSDLRPITKKYIDNIDRDPWDNTYKVVPDQGIIYSLGPNRTDDGGQGDDMTFRFGVVLQPSPQPPSRLQCKPAGTTVNLSWSPPVKNVDGTPLATGVGTWSYEVFRTDTDSFPDTPKTTLAFGSNTWSDSGLSPKTNYYYKLRVLRKLEGKDPIKSQWSNQCGAFVPAATGPEIRRFSPSSRKVAINQPFSLDVDVVDPTANLERVVVTFNGGDSDKNLAGGGNTFRVLKTIRPSRLPDQPQTVSDGQISVTGGIPTTTVIQNLGPIEFVNSKPVITSLRPGVLTFTAKGASSATKITTVDFVVEARDEDKNLKQIKISDPVNGEKIFPETSGNAYPPGTQFAVERVSWTYDLGTTRTIYVTATAIDALAQESLKANAQVAIAADITPPETPTVHMNPSNLCIATDDRVFAWSVRESDRVTIHAESFDAESPPVSYKVLISTVAPTNITSFVDNAITQASPTKPGWTMPITTNEFILKFKDDGTGELREKMQEGKFYYVGVRAINASVPPLENQSIVVPKNPKTGYPQNPFICDLTPPFVSRIGIDNPGQGFVCGGTITGRWFAEDPNKLGGDGSGPYRYRYRVFEKLTVNTTGTSTPPSGSLTAAFGQLIYENESEATEFRFPLPTEAKPTPNKYHNAKYTLAVDVRDTSCRWAKATSTTTIIEDQTPPQLTFNVSNTSAPKIVAPAGTLNDPNTLEAQWNDVFYDPDESGKVPSTLGIKSYEWGISHNCAVNLPFPDIFPGDGSWRFAGISTQDRAVRPNMLTNGDFVVVTVRAFNWAGCASSIVSCSIPVLVDTSLQVNLKPSRSLIYVCPRQQEVEFIGSVTGGGPFFIFKELQPRSDPTDPENLISTNKSTDRTRPYINEEAATYKPKDIGRRTATLEVESYTTANAPAPNLARRSDAPVICRCQPFVLVLNEGDAVTRPSVSILDLQNATLNDPTKPVSVINIPLQPSVTITATARPTDLCADPSRYSNDSSKVGARYAFVTAYSLGPPLRGHVFRVRLEGDVDSGGNPRAAVEEVFGANNETFEQVDISRDGTVAFVTSNVGGVLGGTPAPTSRKYYKLTLDNGFVTSVSAPNDGLRPDDVNRGIKLSASGAFGVGVKIETREVERIENPQSDTKIRLFSEPLAAGGSILGGGEDVSFPLLVDIAPDDKLAAVTGGPSPTNVGFLDMVKGERIGSAIPGDIKEATYGVRFDPIEARRVYFSMSKRLVTFGLGGVTNRITATKVLKPVQAFVDGNGDTVDPELRGIDLPFDGSYVVAAARAVDRVIIAQSMFKCSANGEDGENPFLAGTNSFGTFLRFPGETLVGLASGGRRPIDVNVCERLFFGQPSVKIAAPLTVGPGDTLKLFGTNFTPCSALSVTVGGITTTPVTCDNFTQLTIVIPSGLPPNTPQDVIVRNSQIESNELRDSPPVRVTIKP